MTLRFFTILLVCLVLMSCGNDSTKVQPTPTVKAAVPTKDSAAIEAPKTSRRPPIINITDTLSAKQTVIFMKDSAASLDRVSVKLAAILAFKLDAVVKKNKLKVTGPPIAWYKSNKEPFFFEAGLPVDKRPAKLPANVLVKQIGVDSVVVAHFYGPYELLSQGYEALNDWIKENHKKPAGAPYEVYVSDPVGKDGKPVDPYKVQTDIIYPWK